MKSIFLSILFFFPFLSFTTHTHPPKTLFKLISPSKSNVFFSNNLPDSLLNNLLKYPYIYNGGGVAIGDINNDGLVDIFFSGNMVDDKLYLNKGNLVFEDITQSAIPKQAQEGWHTGINMVDVNNDGFLDIYICRAGPPSYHNYKSNLLLINNQNLTFTEAAQEYGLADTLLSTQAAFFDYDLDGDLDAYIMNTPYEILLNPNLTHGKPLQSDHNKSDHFYENINGKFVDVSQKVQINNHAFGLGLSVGDLDNNGYPDVYVCNDYEDRDCIYMNQNGAFFSDKIIEMTKHISNFAMGNDIGDFNNDGFLDLISVDMANSTHIRSKRNMPSMSSNKFQSMIDSGYHYQYMFNTLQLNNGNNTFSDIGFLAGISKTEWSWGVLFADFNNDQLKDIIITNGYQRDIRDNDFQAKLQQKIETLIQEEFDQLKQKNSTEAEIKKHMEHFFEMAYVDIIKNSNKTKDKNFIFQNTGQLTFKNQTEQWGFNHPVNSNGVAYADLDNDGDLDIITNNLDEVAHIYQNIANKYKNNNFLAIKLVGSKGNPFAIGTRATLSSNGTTQTIELFPTRGFQSSMDYKLLFGLGKNKKIDQVILRWPDQKYTILKDIKANQTLEIDYNNSTFSPPPPITSSPTFFSQIQDSVSIKYQHKENYYNDFFKELLLPHQLSRLGPTISIGDINKDGFEDLILGNAKGKAMQLHLQDANGAFKDAQIIDFYHDIKCEDVGSLLFDYDNDNDLDLYVASGGNEFPIGHQYLQDRMYINHNGNFKKAGHLLPKMHTSTQVVKAADFDQDGDLDLFVGGRLVPGKYPSAPRSYLLQNNGGKFEDITERYAKDLMHPGMVTGAEFGDVNGDGLLDLTLVGEWMPMLVFINKGDRFEKLPPQKASESLWFSLKAADLDQDGDLDFVGGNLGKNCKFKASFDKPFNIYADDFDNNGTWDMMMSSYEGNKNYPVRGRDCSSEQMPFITDSFPTFQAYAIAEITDICGPKIKESLHLTARGFYTAVFINDGKGNFSMKKLPNEAQFSPTKDILIEDLNGDQHLDLILVGNMYDVEVETVRYDAGRGAVLLGDGSGNFEAIPPTESGFFAWDNVKQIRKIKVGNKEVYLLAVNNGKLMVFEKNKKHH